MVINFLTRSLLIFSLLVFIFACSSAPPFELTTAAEKQQAIEDFPTSEAQEFWKYEVKGMDQVMVGHENYRDDSVFDIYYPPSFDFKQKLPVLIVSYTRPNGGVMTVFGKSIRDFHFSFSIGQIFAASGMAVVIYEVSSPGSDMEVLLRYLGDNEKRLGVDTDHVGFFSYDRHAFPALDIASDLSKRDIFTPRCLVIYYPDFLGFFEIPTDVPILLVKAGYFPGPKNDKIDSFIEEAESSGAQLEYIFYEEGEPDFMYKSDTEEAKKVINRTIAFVKENI